MKWILGDGYLYAEHNPTIRADFNGNVYGGGFFSNLFGRGREAAPEIRVPTAQELLQQSYGFMAGQFPQFAQARETGLEALMGQGFAPQVNIPGVDWGQFAPSTFEQGLATSAFAPLMEQAQRQALQIGSLAGIPSAAPAHYGRAIAPAIQNIGQFLAGQQQQRGLTEQARLQQQALSTEQARQFQLAAAIGQDPWQEIMGGAQLGGQQAQLQAQADLANWQQRQQQMGGGSALLSLLGGAGGFMLGGPIGAGIGAAAGGGLGEIFGGGEAPVGFQDVALMSMLGLGGGAGITGGVGGTMTGYQQPAGFPGGQTWSPYGGGGGLGNLFGRTLPVGGGF